MIKRIWSFKAIGKTCNSNSKINVQLSYTFGSLPVKSYL